MNSRSVVPHRRGRRPVGPADWSVPRLAGWTVSRWQATSGRFRARWPSPGDERGDVPGWVMVTLMTAGLVLTLWAVAGPRLEGVFNAAMDRVVGGP